jgi:uncharacterized protein YbjT (DUF2867 family)
MDVVLFGATGMVGQGVLRECLLDRDVQRVLSIGRQVTGRTDPKLREIVRADLFRFDDIESDLAGYDACFFCLGVASAGKSEEEYWRITHDIAVAAATTLVKVNPGMTFVFVSGAGTDSSEKGRTMWARVKGSTENALLRMPFKAAYMFRPAFIQPMHGETSKTFLYRNLLHHRPPGDSDAQATVSALRHHYRTDRKGNDHVGAQRRPKSNPRYRRHQPALLEHLSDPELRAELAIGVAEIGTLGEVEM